jgi:hypothetical protein
MRARQLLLVAAFAMGVFPARDVLAGMGSVVPQDWARSMRLTDSAHARFEAISIFLVALLFSAVAVRWLWNRLARGFPALPRLTLGKAVAVVALWGLLFLVVLTMIAATRELMTPGSWRKVGMLYEVVPAAAAPDRLDRMAERKQHLERLHAALSDHAARYDGRFPDAADAITPAALWEVPGGAGLRYVYVPRRSVGEPRAIVAYEPAVYGDQRLVLYSNGDIVTAQTADLQKQLQK